MASVYDLSVSQLFVKRPQNMTYSTLGYLPYARPPLNLHVAEVPDTSADSFGTSETCTFNDGHANANRTVWTGY